MPCRFLEISFFPWLFVIKPYLTYRYGGMELVAWTIAVPMVFGWHSTFLVNSAAHVYGRQPYDTGKGTRLCAVTSASRACVLHSNTHNPFSDNTGLVRNRLRSMAPCICVTGQARPVASCNIPGIGSCIAASRAPRGQALLG